MSIQGKENKMSKAMKRFLLQKAFDSWTKREKLEEKMDALLIFGRTLCINKKTGKIKVL